MTEIHSSKASSTSLTRVRRGKGFSYHYVPSQRVLKSKKLKSWVKSLAIPPAWEDVKINSDNKAKIYAIGRDAKGRKQYIYNPAWREKREKKKFDRIVGFATKLPKARRVTGQHLRLKRLSRKKVLACMVRLMDNAYFRPGNPHYTAENETYGLTTLRSRHLEVNGAQLEFEYIGKSGKLQHRVVVDKQLAKIVRKLDETPGYKIFQYFNSDGDKVAVTPDDLNEYIRSIIGEDYSSKDFRTWAGTYLAATILDELGVPKDSKTVKKNILKAIDGVAKKLGNTKAVAKANYIDPRIIDRYSEGETISNYLGEAIKRLKSERSELSNQERAVLKLLKRIKRKRS